MCIPAYDQQGATPVVSKRSLIVCKLMRKHPTSHFINHLGKQFPAEFMISDLISWSLVSDVATV